MEEDSISALPQRHAEAAFGLCACFALPPASWSTEPFLTDPQFKHWTRVITFHTSWFKLITIWIRKETLSHCICNYHTSS